MAELDGVDYVIVDEGTMGEFLDEDDSDLLETLVRVVAFDDGVQRANYLRKRWPQTKLAERIARIYESRTHNILPFIGESFSSVSDGCLRVMAVGINSYIGDADWEKKKPSWFRGGFEGQKHRFDKRVQREVTALCPGLTAPGRLFAAHAFDWSKSMFVTNAVKVFLTEGEGKRAEQVTNRLVDYLDQWRDEVEAMIDRQVAPHVIAIFGSPFWRHACESFRAGGLLSPHVAKYEHVDGDALHFVNRVTLKNGHELLLVRLRHPAAPTKKGSAEWLLGQPGFQHLATK